MNFQKLLAACFCAATFLMPTAVFSAEATSLSLAQAVQLAMEGNPQIRTYKLRGDALAGELETASLNPEIRLSAEVENAMGTGDLNWFHGAEFTLALSRVIELGDKRTARSDVVNRRQSLLSAEQSVFELDLLSQVTSRYIDLVVAEQRLELHLRANLLASDILQSVSQRVAVGRAPNAEQARAAAELAMAGLAVQSAEFSVSAAQVHLSSLWGELNPDFAATGANLLQVDELSPVAELLVQLESNPMIEVFASEARLREAELSEARTRNSRDLELGVGIRHLAELNDTALLFQASMPLFKSNRASGAITTAQANLLRSGAEEATALRRMSSQLITLDQQRRLAVNEFQVLRDSVMPLFAEALEATRIAFEGGRYSYLEMSAAQKSLLDAEMNLIEAAARAHSLRVEIERLSGEAYKETFGASAGGEL